MLTVQLKKTPNKPNQKTKVRNMRINTSVYLALQKRPLGWRVLLAGQTGCTKAAQIPEAPVTDTLSVLKHLSQTGCLGTALHLPASPFPAIVGISASVGIRDASSAQRDSWTNNSLFFGSLGYFQNINIKMKSTASFFQSVYLLFCVHVLDLKKLDKNSAYLACSSSVRSFPDTWKVCGYSSLWVSIIFMPSMPTLVRTENLDPTRLNLGTQ